MDLFDEGEITTADKIQRPQSALDRQMFEDFKKRNSMAGGGMLVQPGFGGTRQGYRDKTNRVKYKVITELSEGDLTNFKYPKDHKYKVQIPTNKEGGVETISAKTKKELIDIVNKSPITDKDYAEGLVKFKLPKGATNFDDTRYKMDTGEFAGEGRNKTKIYSLHSKGNKDAAIKYYTTGADGQKRKLYDSIEEVKAGKRRYLKTITSDPIKVSSYRVRPNIAKTTYRVPGTNKEFVRYKPFIGPDKVTIEGKGATTLKEAQKFVDDYFEKNPKKIRVADPEKDYTSKKVRRKALKETDPTGAIGTRDFQYHHIRQIAGGTPLTTDDVMIINQRINSALGTKYNKPLNAISEAIRKNNRLALEAMNAKQEGLALDYMKRVDDLNIQAEKIVNSAIKNLPKKYKGYVGFNAVELPRDEYGLPIGNEPQRVRKIGGMPVSKDAIDLTTLSLKEEKEFRRIVREQAERGQVGKIKGFNKTNLQKLAVIGCGPKAARMGGRINFSTGENLTRCAVRGINKLQTTDPKNLTLADRANYKAIRKTSQGARLLKNVLGPAALAIEALFVAPFAASDYASGRRGRDIALSALSLGLADQKLRRDELKEYFPEYGKGQELLDLDERLMQLERLQKGTKGQRIRSKSRLNTALKKFDEKIKEFPTEESLLDNIEKSKQAEIDLAKDEAERAEQRTSPFDLSDPFSAAGGGIAKLAGVDSGPPPSSGPNSQGLQGLMKRVRNR